MTKYDRPEDDLNGGTYGRNGRNNRQLREWAVYVSLLLSVVALGKTVFFSGNEVGQMQAHLNYNDKRLDGLDMRLDRDEAQWQPQIELFRESISDEQQTAQQEKEVLQDVAQQLQDMRRR
jgi:DNA gyrase/topoisomerase IV subunit A